jgi:hypothetical protein
MVKSLPGRISLSGQNNKPESPMKKDFYKLLAKFNKLILPRYSKRDITKLSKIDKALVAYRYWVTLHALD